MHPSCLTKKTKSPSSHGIHLFAQMVNVAKVVSESWRNLPPTERKVWEEKARLDKERYELEKSRYKGPWKVRAPPKARTSTTTTTASSSSSSTTTTRQQGAPPKKPLSAYLSFSNKNRLLVRQKYPNASNGQISRILASMWREAPEAVKAPFLEEETRLRQEYKDLIAARREQAVLATSTVAAAHTQPRLQQSSSLPYAEFPTTKTTNRPGTVGQIDARLGVGKNYDASITKDENDDDAEAFFEGIVQEFSILHKLDALHQQDAHHHHQEAVFPLQGDEWTTMGIPTTTPHGVERAETTRGAPTAQTSQTATEDRFLEDDLTDDEGVMMMMLQEEDDKESDDSIF